MANGDMTDRVRGASFDQEFSVPDWRKLGVDQPYYNKLSNEYCIAVATDVALVDESGNKITPEVINSPGILEEVSLTGITNLWDFFNKERTEEDNPESWAIDPRRAGRTIHVRDYYIDSRPCSTLRYLVCVDAAAFDELLQNDPEYLSETPSEQVEQIVAYEVHELKRLINSVADSLEENAVMMDDYLATNDVRRPDFDLRREAARLRAVYPSFQRLLRGNGYTTVADESLLTVQFDFGPVRPPTTIVGCPDVGSNFILNVGLRPTDSEVLAEKVRIGYHTFVRNPPIKYARTRGYLRNLRELEEQFECPDKVGTFLNLFVGLSLGRLELLPLIGGIGGMPRDLYDSITGLATGTYDFWNKYSNTRRGRQIVEEVKRRWPFDESKPLKTEDEVKLQTEALSVDATLGAAAAAGAAVDFVGDVLLSADAQKQLRNKIFDTQTAYSELLDKVDLKYMITVALTLLTGELTAERLNELLFEYSMKVLDADALWGVVNDCMDPELIAQTDLRELIGPEREVDTEDAEKCSSEAVTQASDEIVALVATGQIERAALEGCLEKHCPAPARMFGARGHVQNFLYKHTSNFFTFDNENLCPDPSDVERSPWRIPTIDFPNFGNFTITDVSTGIWDVFLEVLRAAADELILGILFELLDIMYSNIERILCNYSDLKNFGTESLKAILGTDNLENPTSYDFREGTERVSAFVGAHVGLVDAAANLAEEVAIRRFKSALTDWGIDPEILEPENDVDGKNYDKRISDFLDEVSSCLNPGELRASLRGVELGQNFEVIERAAANNLPCIEPVDALSVLARASEGAQVPGDRARFGPASEVCGDERADLVEAQFRAGYDGLLPDSVINDLWAQEREVVQNRIGQLIGLLNASYQDSFCGADPGQVKVPSPLDNPATKYMAQTAVGSSYSQIEINFSEELNSWPYSLMASAQARASRGDPAYEVEARRIMEEESTDQATAYTRLEKRIDDGNVSVGHEVVSKILPELQAVLGTDDAFDTAVSDPQLASPYSVEIIGKKPELQLRNGGGENRAFDEQVLNYSLEALAARGRARFGQEDFFKTRYALRDGPIVVTSGEYVALSADESEHLLNPENHDFLYLPQTLTSHSSQQNIFANYLTEPLVKTLNIQEGMSRLSDGAQGAGQTFESFMTRHYPKILDKVVAVLAERFSKSDLFQTVIEDTEDVERKGLLEINLDQSVPGSIDCDNLLRTNFEKKEIMDAFTEMQDEFLQPPAERTTRTPLQKASIPSILRSFIRIHIVEEALLTIFGMSDFGQLRALGGSEFSEDVITKYLIIKIRGKIHTFARNNRASFARLGNGEGTLMERIEAELQNSGLPSLSEFISEEVVTTFRSIGKVIENEFEDQTTNIFTILMNSMPMTAVPEVAGTHEFAGEPGPGGGFLPDLFPWTRETFNSLDSAGYNFPTGNPILPNAYVLDRTADDPSARWRSNQYFDYGSVVIDDQPTPASFSLREEYLKVGNGYFVFEKFIEFEPQALRAIFDNEDENAMAIAFMISALRGRLIDETLSEEQVENKESFRAFFKRAVLHTHIRHTLENPERFQSSVQSWPTSQDVQDAAATVETDFFAKQATASANPDDGAFWANTVLSEVFRALKYGVRLSYVLTEPGSDDFSGELREIFQPGGGVKDLINISQGPEMWDKYCQINKAFEMNIVENSGVLGETKKKIFSIPLFEEVEELPIDDMTIANFYGAEGVSYDAANGGRGKGLRVQVGAGYHYNGAAYREDGASPLPPGIAQGIAEHLGGDFSRDIFTPSFRTLRNRLRDSRDFEILMRFGLNAADILSFLAIYCMEIAEHTHPPVEYAFYNTKMSLLDVLNSKQPEVAQNEFYKDKDPAVAAAGGPSAVYGRQSTNATTSGQSGNAAAKTVPLLIKGLAQFQDPSYSFASKFDRFGLIDGIKPETIVAVLPTNMGGFGPPVTPLGIAAYALGRLPGEKMPFRDRAAAAQGLSTEDQRDCAAEEEE